MVFGEGDEAVLAIFRTASRGFHLVPGRTDQWLSSIHAEDLAAVLLAAAERGERVSGAEGWRRGEGVYHASAGDDRTYADLGRLAGEALGRRVRIVRAPIPVVRCIAAASEIAGRITDRPTILSLDKLREGTAGSWTCDATKARRDLGHRPAASLAERFSQTAAWYRSAGWL